MTIYRPAQTMVARVAELAWKLQRHGAADDIGETLGELINTAVNCVPGAQHAAITLGSPEGVQTVAATAGCPAMLAEIQRRHQGMCRKAEPL